MLEEKRVSTPITGEWTVHRNALTFVSDYFHKLINMLVLADLYIILCVVCIFVSFTEQGNSCFLPRLFNVSSIFQCEYGGKKNPYTHTKIHTHTQLTYELCGRHTSYHGNQRGPK